MNVSHDGIYTIVEIPKSEVAQINFDLCAQPRETLASYYNRMSKPEVLINGTFFNMSDGSTCFSFINDDKVIKNYYGVKDGFGLKRDDKTTLLYGNIDDGTDWWDFCAGYPVLVTAGVPISKITWGSEINYKATRSVIGYRENGDIVLVTAGKPGVKFIDLANYLVNNLHLYYAINLDGGGSSRLMVNGEVVNTPTENRAVDTVVAIYLQKSGESDKPAEDDIPYILYTVKKGDSLWSIATEYLDSGIRYKEIVKLNNLSNNTIHTGQVLKIPVDCKKYIVQRGDSLWAIALKEYGNGARYKEIMEFNNLTSTTLSIGQILYIPI